MVRLPHCVAVVLLSSVCVADTHNITAAERRALIRRAQVWKRTDVSSMDVKAGPQRKDGFAAGETITCDYVPEKLSGASPKFSCALGNDRLKVRYGRTNGEVFAHVAATRLLWALGFGSETVYPVHVVCHGCPAELVGDGASGKGETRFDAAAIERKMHGEDLEAPSVGAGWAWPELDLVDEAAGGAPVAQRDALKLLAVLLQHTDNKPEQQRLLCLDERKKDSNPADCAHPFMMLHDVGLTFGGGNLFNKNPIGSVNLEQWQSAPVWKDAGRCIGSMPPSQTGTLVDPRISEAGRAFLADLLSRLSDDQLRDLFLVARFGDRLMPGGKSEAATVEQWVEAFKKKRAEIVSARCMG